MGSIFSIFILRKLFVASIYFGLASLIWGFMLYYNKEKQFFGRVILYLDYLVGFLMLFAPNIYLLKIFTNYFSFIIIINSLFLLILSFKTKARLNIFASTLFFLTVASDSSSLFLNYSNKFLSPYGIIALFFGFSYNIIQEYKFMVKEIKKVHEKSLKDKLTGVFNRGILDITNFSENDTFVFVDLNRLKEINDTFGHKEGDKILVKFTESARKNFRSNDLIVRMGGDEFLIVLRNCPIEKAEEIMKRISKDFKKSSALQPTFSWGISKFSGSLEETLEKVDEKMYKMKKKTHMENQK